MNISDLLCDLYDIRRMAELEGFGNLPKDNDGTETTIMECLDPVSYTHLTLPTNREV